MVTTIKLADDNWGRVRPNTAKLRDYDAVLEHNPPAGFVGGKWLLVSGDHFAVIHKLRQDVDKFYEDGEPTLNISPRHGRRRKVYVSPLIGCLPPYGDSVVWVCFIGVKA